MSYLRGSGDKQKEITNTEVFTMKTNTRFTFDKVRHDQENDIHLVVTLSAPKKDWEKKRPPVCVFPVIDVSTSMSGQKLDYAKQSALKLVEHLQDGDYAGLAIFHDGVDLVSAPLKMNQKNKDTLRQRIGDLNVQGCTNFSGGMLKNSISKSRSKRW